MRPIRRKIQFDEESMNHLMQELYNDSHNMKSKITRLFTKWEQKVKEGGEIAALGDQIVKLIAAEAKNQDQKIMLFKYLKDIVSEKNGGKPSKAEEEGSNKELTADDRNELLRIVKKEIDLKNK